MNLEQVQELLALEEEFGSPSQDQQVAVAQGLRQELDGRALKRLKYEALRMAYEQSQRALGQFLTNGEKENHIAAMRMALQLAEWPELYVKQVLEKPEKEPYKSHFRG